MDQHSRLSESDGASGFKIIIPDTDRRGASTFKTLRVRQGFKIQDITQDSQNPTRASRFKISQTGTSELKIYHILRDFNILGLSFETLYVGVQFSKAYTHGEIRIT